MKAAVLHELGQPPRFEDFADPTAGKDEALIRVHAASLKMGDKQLASGSHYASPQQFPIVCRVDGLGTLEDGSRVFFGGPSRPYAAMAEVAGAPPACSLRVPAEMILA